jgi:predicted nucleotidyltransferase
MKGSYFSKDIQEFIRLLSKYKVRYVIVGGEAVIYYGYARLTGDIDFFYEPSPVNAGKLYKALDEFWNGKIPGIKSSQDLLSAGIIIQFGISPNRIDLLNLITGITFKEAWKKRRKERIKIAGQNYLVLFIGLEELIKNKESVRRFKDLDDLQYLRAIKKRAK